MLTDYVPPFKAHSSYGFLTTFLQKVSSACCDLCTASVGPHQAKQFHVRFIGRERERGKVAAEREGGKRERDQGGLSLYMGDDVITGKGER